MKGIINFLISKDDYRAHLLRKYFVFVLIPMLNPDGVSNGHCRMDTLNQNLNRYYKNPDPSKQPACYSTIKLNEHYSKDKKLFMYLDLHAHPANKGNFIFGNAIFDYIDQVESHVFPKILSQNCINFEFEQCIFSRKHMKAKDRN
jgi:murein tripeptide amidase MpaA